MTTDPNSRLAIRDYLQTYLQYLYPQHFLSCLMFYATRWNNSVFKDWLIRWFVRRYRIDMTLAENPEPSSYASFNAFFTRSLRTGARPTATHPDDIVSPADGVISQLGHIENGRMLQAKGRWYTVAELLQSGPQQTAPFEDGAFATIYLSPRDYHRVHMPSTGKLKKMSYLPGRLFSVSQATTSVLPNLFARNERMVAHFDSALGPMAVVMVGALFVGSIETVWHGLITPPHAQKPATWSYPPGEDLNRGAEMGRFNMGSTVIVLLPRDAVVLADNLAPGSPVQMGQVIRNQTS